MAQSVSFKLFSVCLCRYI